MELKISEIPSTVCLNMIVKNESHIIKETLEMLCSKINFSYWVICDTGSTDNTKEIISSFFKDKYIPGEIYEHTWKNFAHNRTLALDAAFNKTDLLFVFDADDEIHGTIDMPKSVDSDGYYLNFGNESGISYQRILLVNNRIKWNYQSVIHEFINCLKPNPKLTTINGNYYVVSGRRGSRNNYPEKYLKDAKILEEEYYEAKKVNDKLFLRYAFYCANSYKDAGKSEEAIKWYKITLNNDNWFQEKYICCLNLYYEYNKLGEAEKGIFYLIESFKYDTERHECAYLLIRHYCVSNHNNIAYSFYTLIQDFYENRYSQSDTSGKLFIEQDKSQFYLPYFMILVADKVKQNFPVANNTIVKMYEIIFTKKYKTNDDFHIGNLLYNLQFFIELCVNNNKNFITVFQSYIDFLENINYNLIKYDFLKKFEKYGIKIKSLLELTKPKFTQDECKQSNKILFYSGFSNVNWNYSYSINNALGGSETALINLAKSFPTYYDIYISGSVQEEKHKNITFVNLDNLKTIVKNVPFHTVIVSRYIAFYEMYPDTSFYKSFIWGHDTCLYHWGCNLDVSSILKKWENKINGCVCQTEWHEKLFRSQYSELNNKLLNINNGIDINKFTHKPVKFTNRFIYTSCSERGLDRLLELWPQIIEKLPNAELFIASYNRFPQNEYEVKLQTIINNYDSIKHVGTLNKDKLYNLMSSAEFWLYPTNFLETSCITSMEMLMSEVICIYYPIAGLVNTLGNYGITVERNKEIETILDLSMKQKFNIRQRGKEYALSCSWENRANEWMKLIDDANKNIKTEDQSISKELRLNLDNKLNMWRNLDIEPYYNFPISKNWFGYSELKNHILNNVDLYKQYNILEIGSFEGCSSCFLSDILINNNLSSLTCVDPFVSDGCTETVNSLLKQKFYSNINKSQNYKKITIIEKFSDDFYSTYKGNKFNFIYINGEHSEKQILKDLEECFSLLDINGLIWCDDYNNQWKHIFDYWILSKNNYINIIHSGYQLGFIKIKEFEIQTNITNNSSQNVIEYID